MTSPGLISPGGPGVLTRMSGPTASAARPSPRVTRRSIRTITSHVCERSRRSGLSSGPGSRKRSRSPPSARARKLSPAAVLPRSATCAVKRTRLPARSSGASESRSFGPSASAICPSSSGIAPALGCGRSFASTVVATSSSATAARDLTPDASQRHDRLEPAVDHALGVERHRLRVHHAGEARVLHHLRVDAIPVRARLEDDPRKEHDLAGLELDALRKRGELSWLDVIREALDVLERAVL